MLTLICVNWIRTENEEMNEWERDREREVGGDDVCGCSFGESLKQETSRPLYIFKCCLFYHSVTGVSSAIGKTTL